MIGFASFVLALIAVGSGAIAGLACADREHGYMNALLAFGGALAALAVALARFA